MTGPNLEHYDQTGKVIMSEIYNKSDPRIYFSFLKRLKYSIPQQAKPVFLNILGGYRRTKNSLAVKVVDLGCSYGVNAALLKCGLDMDDLYELYGSAAAARLDRSALIARDRKLFSTTDRDPSLEIVGMDAAERALAYAEQVRLLDDSIAADFEVERTDMEQRALLRDADLIISTGCIGYVTERSLKRILEPAGPRKPWLAHFVLRMFSYESIRQMLLEHGYVTARAERTYLQRRFASEEEQEHVLERLMAMGIDPSGKETEGWLHANFYLSRPESDIDLVPATELIPH